MTPIAQPGVVEGVIRRLTGFDVYETNILSENGAKLVGFAVHPSCLAVAMRCLIPVADYDEAVTDPDTGFTFGYLRYTETSSHRIFVTVECLRLQDNHRRQPQAHREAVRRLNPCAKIVRATRSAVPQNEVLNTSCFDFEEARKVPGWIKVLRGEEMSEADEYGFSSLVYRARRPFLPVHFWKTIQREWTGVVRSKSFFWLATRPVGRGDARRPEAF